MAKKRVSQSERDDGHDALYVATPRAFVAERKRIADALKAAGRAEAARAVAKMKRPTASVWAVNQLARQAPDEVAGLLALGASLRAGERKLLRGGAADGFMDEARTARQTVAALARRAEALLVAAGEQKATIALGRKIAQTLHAASIGDDATRDKLRAGRLDEDLSPPSSFGGGADLSAALAASVAAKPKKERARVEKKSAATDERSPGPDERKRAAAERKRAAAALRDQRRAQAAERKQAAALERVAVAAERVVAERARAVERARAAVEGAEVELRAAKDALVDAETAAAAARRAAVDARR